MNDSRQEVPIFKSSDPEAFARAVAELNAAGIPFRSIGRNERSMRFPLHVYWLLVDIQHEAEARQAIANVPTELILPPHEMPPPQDHRTISRIQLVVLAIVILMALIISLLHR